VFATFLNEYNTYLKCLASRTLTRYTQVTEHGQMRDWRQGAVPMNKEDIEKYLRMLGQELQKKQVIGEVLLVGGAVMLLEVGNREVTKDIDAYFEPKYSVAIREAVITIAQREGLPVDWLNDGVKDFSTRSRLTKDGQNIQGYVCMWHR